MEFSYYSLDTGSRQIRVLLLQPISTSEEDDDLVNGFLATISLDPDDENAVGHDEVDQDLSHDDDNDDWEDVYHIPYETISYVWDDPTLRFPIRLNGDIVDIPQSAEKALRRFRWKNSERVVWIDAVCINQADLVERSQQVAIMADIYKGGFRNLVYLGDEDETTAAAARDIHLLCNTEIDAEIRRVGSLHKLLYDEDGNFQLSDWPLRTKIDEAAVARFYSKPWFRRLWVVQEATLAPKSSCYCGEVKMRLFGVLMAAQWLSYKKNFLEPDVWDGCKGRHNAARIFDLMPSIHTTIGSGEYRPDVLGLLDIARNTLCSDPRDKVFGILGLIKWSGSPAIPAELTPDYTRDLKDVLTSAAVFAIRENDEEVVSKLLEDVSHRSDSDIHLDGLPSWVPRWHRERNRDFDALWLNYQNGMPLLYRLGWLPEQISEVDMTGSPSVQYTRWIVEGVQADEIELVYPPTQEKFEWRNFVGDYLLPLQELFKEIRHAGLPDILDMLTWRRWANLDGMSGEQMEEGVAFLERLLALGPGRDWDDSEFEVETAIISGCNRRVVGKTEAGHPALLPFISKPGDKVVQLLEVNTPTILRPCGEHFEVIGQAYVDRMMACEYIKGRHHDGEEMDSFSLI